MLAVHGKANGESRRKQLREEKDRFLSMALVTDQRDCLLTLILDIESLFLNLNSYSQIRSRAAHGGLSKPLQRSSVQWAPIPPT